MSGHIVYGQALYEARQFEESKAVFETALSLDPENLIALRHLGDIALVIGDSEAARGWYRRVLEADPRNEDIQAQLAKLDSGAGATAVAPAAATAAGDPAASVPTPVASAPAVPTAASTKKPTPSSAPTVVISAVRPPPKAQEPPPPPVTAESPTAEIRLDTVSQHAEPTQAPRPIQALELEAPVAGASAQDAPPLDSFSLDGLETTSLAANEPAPAPPLAPPPLADLDLGVAASAPQPATPETAPLPDLDFGGVSVPPAAAKPTAAPPASTVPLDLDFAAPAPAPAVAAPVPELLDLGEPVAPVSAPSPPPTAVPELDIGEIVVPAAAPAAEVEPQASESQPLEFLSVDEASEPAPESGPFVTETMAELYLQQGHREEALRVYRALLEQRPSDAPLQAKVASLEAEFKPRAPAPAPAPTRPAAPPPRRDGPVSMPRTGPTIREVLYVVAVRRPGFRAGAPGQNGSTPVEAASGAPVPSSLGPDAIAALFGYGAIAPADEGAAMSLALAFSDLNGGSGTAPIEAQSIAGAPARQASTELSLDTVFGGGSTPPAAPSSFSFDQFFSQRASAQQGSTGATGGGAAASDRPDDVAQFTQWLEGLKQR
jgi:tetratricopeptide (TPR) repeat protein